MKLLFDQNLSWKLCGQLADISEERQHVRECGLIEGGDIDIWEFAKKNGLIIVTKDKDFQQRSLLFGHPPKVIWLRVGNCSVIEIEELLRTHSVSIHNFEMDIRGSYLILP